MEKETASIPKEKQQRDEKSCAQLWSHTKHTHAHTLTAFDLIDGATQSRPQRRPHGTRLRTYSEEGVPLRKKRGRCCLLRGASLSLFKPKRNVKREPSRRLASILLAPPHRTISAIYMGRVLGETAAHLVRRAVLPPPLPQPPPSLPSYVSVVKAVYRLITAASTPIVAAHLLVRQAFGKESKTRMRERWGFATKPRPFGRLVWFHAASLGEGAAALPLIMKILEESPSTSVLVTGGSVAADDWRRGAFPEKVIRQFVPVDTPRAAGDAQLTHLHSLVHRFIRSAPLKVFPSPRHWGGVSGPLIEWANGPNVWTNAYGPTDQMCGGESRRPSRAVHTWLYTHRQSVVDAQGERVETGQSMKAERSGGHVSRVSNRGG